MPHHSLKASLLILLFSISSFAFADSDFMAKESITIKNPRSKEIISAIMSDLKGILENVILRTNRGTKVLVPYNVKGSQARPIMTMTIRKCVFTICKTVAIDTEFIANEVRGKCDLNYVISGDFRRSSAILTDIYEKMTLNLCFNADVSGSGTATVNAYLVRAPKYSSDIVQDQIFSYLKLQVQPMVRAVEKSVEEEAALLN